jgi:hypothetical protein
MDPDTTEMIVQPQALASARLPIGYPQLRLGLNNQKMALLGLVNTAFQSKRPMTLPYFVNFDPQGHNHIDVAFSDIFSMSDFKKFAAGFGIEILDGEPLETTDGWASFQAGAHVIGQNAIHGAGGLDGLTYQFFRHLKPRVTHTPLFEKLSNSVFAARAIEIVAQFRIERDWMEAANSIREKEPFATDDYAPDYLRIISKIVSSCPEPIRKLYVVCDESNLPVSKAEMQITSLDRYGVELVFKTDILSPDELRHVSSLELSIIDFEMAVSAPIFVGFTRSTFSNLVSFETLCRRRSPSLTHYIYNVPGDRIASRCDSGAHVAVSAATDPIHLREPLIPATVHDCLWPASLTAHISNHGDLESRNALIPGTRTGHLVCGIRHNPLHLIEGFSIDFPAGLPGALEYRARLHDGLWTDWKPPGSFVGSTGERRALRGFAVRLTGQLALGYDAICVGSFADAEALVISSGGEPCATPDLKALEALQIIFRQAD